MDPLIIEANETTPGVILDSEKSIFKISGWSHPEDAIRFYSPVIEWMNTYAASPNPETNFIFHFQYYNTSAAKQIFRLISMLEEVAKKSKTKISWHYNVEDADMHSSGERFSKMSTVPFEFISH